MPQFSRYAVYYAPPDGSALAEFGASWLGWDAARAQERVQPALDGLTRPASEVTGRPRNYGFHGTLKPPFRLRGGTTRDGLEAEIDQLAGRIAPFQMPRLSVAALGGFVALVPEGDVSALRDLAAACVMDLDQFRARPGEAELARRRQTSLSDGQEAMLSRWGYPYVLDEFRFHMTLSGPLSRHDQKSVVAALEPVLTPLLHARLPAEELCLFGEAGDGRFHILRRFALTG